MGATGQGKSSLNIAQLKKYCSQLPAVELELLGPPSNVLFYTVGSKKFAYFKTSEPEKWRFSFRTTPDRFLELTDVAGIKPARYMGRFHWVTIVDVRTIDENYLRELVEWSYNKAWHSLSKKQRDRVAAALTDRSLDQLPGPASNPG